jgi:hypothetical protein
LQKPLVTSLIHSVAAGAETCTYVTEAEIQQIRADQRVVIQGGDCLIDFQMESPYAV